MATAIVAAAAVGVAGSIWSGEEERKATNTAADKAETMQRESLEFQKDQWTYAKNLLKESVELGVLDVNEAYDLAEQYLQEPGIFADMMDPWAYNMAREFMQSPEDVMDLPGAEFEFQQGQRALENMLSSTTGGGLSGAGMEAAIEYGQNFAATKIDQYLNRLFPFINLSALAGEKELNRRVNLANIATSRGESLANIRLAGAGAAAGASGRAAGNVAQTYTNMANIAWDAGKEVARIKAETIDDVTSTTQSLIGGYTTYTGAQGAGYSNYDSWIRATGQNR